MRSLWLLLRIVNLVIVERLQIALNLSYTDTGDDFLVSKQSYLTVLRVILKNFVFGLVLVFYLLFFIFFPPQIINRNG